jgi:hypothetical protein
MTITANSNLGWEVAGNKRNSTKKFNEQANNTKAAQNNKDLIAKIPRIETLRNNWFIFVHHLIFHHFFI